MERGDVSTRFADANRLIDDEPHAAGGAPGTMGRLERLCGALTRAIPASGAGLGVMTEDGFGGGTVASSGPASRRLEELQFTLGEGPCIDAYTSRRPVLEPDLFHRGTARWPGYAAAAQEEGARAVFVFPLQVGAARVGTLDVFRDQPGSLSKHALAQAFTFAEIAMGLLLDNHADGGRGMTSADLDDVLAYRLEVYQAQGMVMVALGVRLDAAAARLRAHAFADGRSLSDVARDIVAGSLRLDRDAL